jgi:hypothetical protein
MDYDMAIDIMDQYEFFLAKEIRIPGFFQKQVDQALIVLSGGNPLHPTNSDPLPNVCDLANMFKNCKMK